MVELFLSAALVFGSFVLQGNIGLDFSDEGFLWNGVRRAAQGNIPIRDFHSYDPGRYYWCFAWSGVFGLEILGVRRAVAAFQVLGLWAGLLALSRIVDDPWVLAASGVVMIMWMHEHFKVFEFAVTLIAVYFGALLVETPSLTVCFLAGSFVGFAGFIGRNHGLYCFCSFAALILIVSLKNGEAAGSISSSYAVWLAGVVLGYTPMLVMLVFIPGMFERFWDAIVGLLRRGATNVPLPIPWPWIRAKTGTAPIVRLSQFGMGCHYIVMPVFYGATIAWAIVAKSIEDHALLIASAMIGASYMHHAFSRTDLTHLCQSIQPFLLAVMAAAGARADTVFALLAIVLLAIVGFFTVRPVLPLMIKWDNRHSPVTSFVKFDLNGERLWLSKFQARFFTNLKRLVEELIKDGEPLFIAPRAASLYPILKKETPVRSDFLLYPETYQKQLEIIRDLDRNRVNWALIGDFRPDGRDDMLFRNTHEFVWDHLTKRFEPVPTPGIGKAWKLLRRKDVAGLRSDMTCTVATQRHAIHRNTT